MKEIKGFFGEYRFLSNFTPVTIEFEWYSYPSVEHAYVASKTLYENERAIIRGITTPAKAKIYGRGVTLRHDWASVKIPLMRNFIDQKFNYPIYKDLLLKTKDAYIEETNTWSDTFWGVYNGYGENNLGKLLMWKRDELRKTNP